MGKIYQLKKLEARKGETSNRNKQRESTIYKVQNNPNIEKEITIEATGFNSLIQNYSLNYIKQNKKYIQPSTV